MTKTVLTVYGGDQYCQGTPPRSPPASPPASTPDDAAPRDALPRRRVREQPSHDAAGRSRRARFPGRDCRA